MPNPSLSSFTNSSQYQTQTTLNPLLTGFIAGSTYREPNFNGNNQATSNDVGGLFGWLLYSRATQYTPALGSTGETYLVYTSPNALVADLNQLGGITYCLVSSTTQGGTFGFFKSSGSNPIALSALTAGVDFLYAINYLAYGGTLVIAGTTGGLDSYETANSVSLDLLIGSTANSSICSWLVNKPYLTAVFPTGADSTGQLGAGYTMAAFDGFAGVGSALAAKGSTFSTRIFNVYGVKTSPQINTDSVVANSVTTYKIAAISDVAGAFTRAKERNELFLSVAGLNRSTVLNGTLVNSVNWDDTNTKNILRTNRVNFFVNYNPAFLGQDLVGATAGTSTTITVDERVGPSRLKISITRDVTTIGLKYLYQLNNAATRSSVSAEISSYLEKYAQYLDTTQTQIICNSTNNQDNSTALNIMVKVKPIATVESLTIFVNLLQ